MIFNRQRWPVKSLALTLVMLAGVVALATVVRAQPSGGEICIDPDIEFPVACDDDDD